MHTILLVNDEIGSRTLIRIMLERKRRCEVIQASTGDEALPLVYSRKPDLIFMDDMMPGTLGDEICKRIKADPAVAHIPVVMTPVRSNPEHIAYLHGIADDVLTLPFLFYSEEFKAILDRYLPLKPGSP